MTPDLPFDIRAIGRLNTARCVDEHFDPQRLPADLCAVGDLQRPPLDDRGLDAIEGVVHHAIQDARGQLGLIWAATWSTASTLLRML